MRALAILLVSLSGSAALNAQPADCKSPEQCREMTLDAIAREEYERAHDLAWRLVQTSPRRDRDTSAMSLLARAASLSGRGYDALVILQRLADAGVIVEDAETSDDFRRARDYPEWPRLAETMARLRASNDATIAPRPSSDGTRAAPPDAAPAPASAAPPASATPSAPAAASARKAPSAPSTRSTPVSPAAPASPAAPSPPATPEKPSAAAKSAAPATTASPAKSAASEKSAASATPAAPAVPVPPVAPVSTLPWPPGLDAPAVFAHDAVSARFIVASDASDMLQVLSESSGTATRLVSAGWSAHARTTAVAIDRRSGDLWVAGELPAATGGDGRASLHRLQLISGRRLQEIAVPEDSGAARFVAIALGPRALFVLDAAGRRVFTLAAGAKQLRQLAVLPDDVEPIALAAADRALYVSHTRGLLRVDAASGRHDDVAAAADVHVAGVHSMAWHDGALVGIRSVDGAREVVRVRLNRRGTGASGVDSIAPAASTAGVLSGDVYYYLARRDGGAELAVEGVPLTK